MGSGAEPDQVTLLKVTPLINTWGWTRTVAPITPSRIATG